MLKMDVKYEDFNGNDAVDTLYFNLSKTEMVDMLDMQSRLEAWAKSVQGEERTLTPEEAKEMLAILRYLIDKSYGKRSEDGKRFIKSLSDLEEFQQSPAYDEFLFSLIQDPERANDFIEKVMPKGLLDDVQAQSGSTLKSVSLPGDEGNGTELKFEDFTEEQLLEMPQDEFDRIVGRDPKKMNQDQLRIAFMRKSKS